jgi:hypothetical protein
MTGSSPASRSNFPHESRSAARTFVSKTNYGGSSPSSHAKYSVLLGETPSATLDPEPKWATNFSGPVFQWIGSPASTRIIRVRISVGLPVYGSVVQMDRTRVS